MKILKIFIGFLCVSFGASSQTPCLTNLSNVSVFRASRSVNDLKIVRINFHFMLRSNGTGNFTEINDNNGNNFSGYDYARTITDWMNGWNSFNQQMRLPPGNSTPVNSKNVRYVIDAVDFRRNDLTTTLGNENYTINGRDKDNVINIFICAGASITPSGFAGSGALSENSKIKYTGNDGIYGHYLAESNAVSSGTQGWINYHPQGCHLNHEIMHNLGLSHTVQYNSAPPCRTNCGAPFVNPLVGNPAGNNPGFPVDVACDDGCNDTPTAWDMAQLYNCQYHPACGFADDPWCSNNVMDYSGDNALTPCQISIIHSFLESGMRSYLACDAVKNNLSLCDIGYPKLSYFGKDVSIGCTSSAANLTTKEKVDVYTSNFVELTNFEVATDAAFEVYHLPVCGF